MLIWRKSVRIGASNAAGILYNLALHSQVQIKAVYDNFGGKKCFGLDVMPAELIKNYPGKVIVTDIIEVEDKVEMLKKLGVQQGENYYFVDKLFEQ